jgi:hypothetical protein
MGTFNKGILGGFSGKTGTVIGSNWKGRTVMRSLPGKRTKAASPDQLDQQEKFALVVSFLSSMTDLLKITFRNFASKVSGFNAAVSYNLQKAVSGEGSPFTIDYSMAQVSLGFLPNASSPMAVAETGNKVSFSWMDNSGTGRAKSTDAVILVAFCAATGRSVYSVGEAFRGDLTLALDTSVFAGKEVQTWICFVSDDSKMVSDSFYTGAVTLEP